MQLPGPGVLGPPRDHDQALAVLRRAIELGINHIDTAQFYGPNVANELIREALHPYPDNLALVSKVGGDRDEQGNWLPAQQPDDLRRGIEDNLRTLATDRLAAVNLRVMGAGDDPSSPGEVDRELFDRQLTAMIKARDEGLIAGIGLSSISLEHLQIALDRTEIVCVQNAYNLVDRTSQPVLDACLEHGIAFVPFFPLGSAFTADNPVLGHPAVQREAAETRAHPGADRARVDTVGCTERAADSGHVVGRTPRGEHRRRRHRVGRRDQDCNSTTRPSSVDVDPVQRPLHRLLPARVAGRALVLAPCGRPALVLLPIGPKVIGVLPEPDRQARGVRGAQARSSRRRRA